jgi:hypothetical protein
MIAIDDDFEHSCFCLLQITAFFDHPQLRHRGKCPDRRLPE